MEHDPELRELIRRWSAPGPSAGLDIRMMERYRNRRTWRTRWRWLLWGTSVRVPLPAVVLAVALAVIVSWRWSATGHFKEVKRAERVETPVQRDSRELEAETPVVQAPSPPADLSHPRLLPVREIRPVIWSEK